MKTANVIRPLLFGFALVVYAVSPAATRGDDKTADALVGKWVPASGKEKGTFVEFTKDGNMTYTFGTKDDQTYKGKYKVIDDKTVEVEFSEDTLKKNNLLSKKPKKAPIMLAKDQLTFDPTLFNIKKTWVREK